MDKPRKPMEVDSKTDEQLLEEKILTSLIELDNTVALETADLSMVSRPYACSTLWTCLIFGRDAHAKVLQNRFAFEKTELMEADRHDAVSKLLEDNRVSTIQWLVDQFYLTKENIVGYRSNVFSRFGKNNCLDMLKYLKSELGLDSTEIHAGNDGLLRQACMHGRAELVEWLLSNFSYSASNGRAENNFALRWACAKGHFNIVLSLHTAFRFMRSDVMENSGSTIMFTAYHGHTEIFKWLCESFSITREDIIFSGDNFCFRKACANGFLDLAQYIHEKYKISARDLYADNCEVIRAPCANGRLDVVQWLLATFDLTSLVSVWDNNPYRMARVNKHDEIANIIKQNFRLYPPPDY